MQSKCSWHIWYGGFLADFYYSAKYWNSDRIKLLVRKVRVYILNSLETAPKMRWIKFWKNMIIVWLLASDIFRVLSTFIECAIDYNPLNIRWNIPNCDRIHISIWQDCELFSWKILKNKKKQCARSGTFGSKGLR